MEELISAFANNSNKTYESVGSNLSSKGRFELIRSNDWVTPNQSDIEEPLLNTQDLFQQLREDLANLKEYLYNYTNFVEDNNIDSKKTLKYINQRNKLKTKIIPTLKEMQTIKTLY